MKGRDSPKPSAFEGAGITWGIIGFTLSNGELGALLTDIRSAHPAVFSEAFGELETRIVDVINSSHSDQIHFANSISVGTSKMRILDVWAKAFEKLGSDSNVQAIGEQQASIHRGREKAQANDCHGSRHCARIKIRGEDLGLGRPSGKLEDPPKNKSESNYHEASGLTPSLRPSATVWQATSTGVACLLRYDPSS